MKKILTPLIVLLVIALIPCVVNGQTFKNSENDPLQFLRSLPRPNMLIIADTSGSMRYSIYGTNKTVRDTSIDSYDNVYTYDSDHPNSRMKNLKNAISAVVTSVEGINFGLARFNNHTNNYYYMGNYNHTFTSNTTIYKYCYEQDHKDAIPMNTSDCIWLDACYVTNEDSSTAWGTDSDCSVSNPYDRHVHISDKRYYYSSKSTVSTGTYTLWHRERRSYDPFAETPVFPPEQITTTTNGHTYTLDMHYYQVYADQYTQGLYIKTDTEGKPHVSVDIRYDKLDLDTTPEDEADNTDLMLKATGSCKDEGAFIPMGGTPLSTAMSDAQTYFVQTIIPRDDDRPDIKACRKNFVLLITDGEATTGYTAFPEVAQSMYNNYGIKTYGIALSLANTTQINQCADMGDDGVDNNSSTAYACNNTDDVVDAIKDIVSKISDQLDSMAPPVVSTVYSHPYWDDEPAYAGQLDSSEAILVMPFFQFPSWRGHLLATWLYFIEYNSRIPDDPLTTDDERWVTYNYNPQDMWTAGYILSKANAPLADTNADTYINELDTAVANAGYKTADSRTIYTTNANSGTLSLIPFNTTLPDKANRLGVTDASVPSVILTAWTADKARRQYTNDNELADVVINYIRGKQPVVDSADIDTDGSTFDFQRDVGLELVYEERDWKLGDSVMSIPGIISEPAGFYKKKFFGAEYILPSEQTFEEFQNEYADRPNVVLYGASDGLLHCLALKDTSASTTFGPSGMYSPPKNYIGGEEIWAFVPGDPDVMEKLKYLAMDYNGDGVIDGQIYNNKRGNWLGSTKSEWIHWYYLDGPTRFSNVFIDEDSDGIREWKTIAIVGEGRGGRYYYCFDITNPFSPRLMWKFPPADASATNMGMTLSTPAIAYQSVPSGGYRWLAIFGAGYDPYENATNDVGQYIYALDIADGSVVYSFNNPASEIGVKKAMVTAPPSVLNSQASTDYIDDKVFVGDTDGRLWRFDLNSEVMSKRLDFENENQAIVAGISAAHASGESVWWDVIFVGTGGDTRVTDTINYRLVGFIDEAFNLPYSPMYATIAESETGDMNLPAPITFADAIDSFTGTPYVFMHIETDGVERLDAQPTTNVMEATTYTKLQSFFTLFDPGTDPCIIGTSRLIEIDHLIDKEAGTLERTTLPSGAAVGSLDLGEGKSGGTYISDGVVFAPAGSNLQMFGKPVPPPSPKGNKVVVNVLSWKVLTD